METENAANALEGDKPSGDTFFLPGDFCGGKEYKAGDTITLTVVAPPDEDGDVEVKMAGSGEGEKPDWKDDMRESVPDDGSGGMM